MVIDRAPLIQALLHSTQIGKDRAIENLGFQRAMETLFFALSLRMARPTVTNPNAQLQQPDRQRSVGMLAVTAPGRAVIQQHPLRQSVTAKGFRQSLLNRVPPLIAAPLQADGIAGMIIQHRQGVTAGSIAQGKMPFEVHLPQLIGGLMLETLPRLMFGRLGRVDPPMPLQYGMYGTGGWQPGLTQGLQPRPNLASSPSWVRIAHRQHLLLGLPSRPSGRALRTARPIAKSLFRILPVASQPFVARGGADGKAPTQLSDISTGLQS